jgi:two-component system, NtrC family, nitrogen regulation response regulator NtrX
VSVNRRILIVDDEQGIRAALAQLLEFEGYEVRAVGNATEGIAEYTRWKPQLVFLDVKMAGIDGLEALRRIRELDPAAIVVMISGHATIQTAVEATQLGAYDILEKPLDTDRILVTLRNALSHLALHEENARLRNTIESRYELVGKSFALNAVIDKIEKVAGSPARVLISGENGTGKELVARAIHRRSPRAGKPFVEVNCAAIPSELIESELFGHVKGSFTGAIADRAGKFEQADGGTLFLDEIGDMSLAAQAKVLRVLQDGVVTRIGGVKPIQVDVRALAATNKDLEREIAEGRFREDLFYRLNVVRIHMPPLRERRDDIRLLVNYFLQAFAKEQAHAPKSIAPGVIRALEKYHWPGNVRELENIIRRALVVAKGDAILLGDLPAEITGQTAAGSLPVPGAMVGEGAVEDVVRLARQLFAWARRDPKLKIIPAVERELVIQALKEASGNQVHAAKLLGITRATLRKRIEKFQIERELSIK